MSSCLYAVAWIDALYTLRGEFLVVGAASDAVDAGRGGVLFVLPSCRCLGSSLIQSRRQGFGSSFLLFRTAWRW